MSGIRLERPGNVANTESASSATLQHIGSYLEGDVIDLRCRYAETYINGVTAPVESTWEGPYVRVYPMKIDNMLASTWAEGQVVTNYAGANITIPAETDPYYEFDAISCPSIVLPFPASLSLAAYCAGFYAFDIRAKREGKRHVEPKAREYRQTRYIAGDVAVRHIPVPRGAIDYALTYAFASPPTQLSLVTETAGKTAGLGTSLLTMIPQAADYQGYRRSIAGAGRISVTTAAGAIATTGAAITFYCQMG